MDLKRGHKSSDLGTIPEDWNVITLGSLNPFITSGSRGWAKYYPSPRHLFASQIYQECRYTQIYSIQKFSATSARQPRSARTQLKYGDLLISITADIGISGFADNSIPSPAYINQHIALVRFDPDKSDAKFLSYYLASEAAQRVFSAGTDQGAKAGMNLPGIRAIKTVFPSLKEQHRIATARRAIWMRCSQRLTTSSSRSAIHDKAQRRASSAAKPDCPDSGAATTAGNLRSG
ncbi:MAG: restriction endonuclease subunit S [Deltaproteobacteria bacterium]|nr:restriction endonuclease subunit S [Deltaproteobacteria bacterium]